ncbi:MAG TPA: hypothetical protein VEU07_10100, partial [Candidatus Acidoferrum sp.]|nr:hypothetical protein [Candidatus Acidoferrum sp.]
TRSGPFDHDTTLAVPPYPGLEPMRRLGALPPKGDEARQLCVELVRQRNKVSHHFRRASAEVEATLAGC